MITHSAPSFTAVVDAMVTSLPASGSVVECLFAIEFSGAIRKLAGGEFAGGLSDILLFFA